MKAVPQNEAQPAFHVASDNPHLGPAGVLQVHACSAGARSVGSTYGCFNKNVCVLSKRVVGSFQSGLGLIQELEMCALDTGGPSCGCPCTESPTIGDQHYWSPGPWQFPFCMDLYEVLRVSLKGARLARGCTGGSRIGARIWAVLRVCKKQLRFFSSCFLSA